MNVPATNVAAETVPVKAADVCHIVVLHEDVVAYGRAMEMAGRLAAEFRDDPAFALSSWDFRQLAEPAFARKAAEAAAHADVLLLSAHGNDLPSAVGAWLELCVGLRTRTEGALALLLAEPFMLSASSGAIIARLQHAARLLGMDFLSLMPQPAEQIIKSFQERANVVTSAILEILDRPGSDHWGLNE
jgi:hypothetical protein